ncbi:MAG: rhodanese-like domain-containing protein [Ferrimicrobium sp.]|jgi:rhodanese-related sulfurtransferase|uniref:rhodanese-like domain-containing protein n=1 Tax=Ferrimicrobium sp. TaxID=2926050 RepID=UPI00263618CF|nr:rhodanese-like domain-containing protein [Ferrimicrobium sp.]
MIQEIDVRAFAAAHRDGATIVDVREAHEYESGHVPGSRNIPLSQLPYRLHELPKRERIHLICESGSRSATAAAHLSSAGFQALTVVGGVSAWRSAGQPTVTGSRANVA